MPPVPLLTADEFFDWQPPDKDTELVRGRMIVREPPRLWHGLHAANLCRIVSSHVWSSRLGAVLAQDTGFHIARDPDTVLAPDLAFIRADRLPSRDADRYPAIVPDLVAEIMSPSDRRRVVVARCTTGSGQEFESRGSSSRSRGGRRSALRMAANSPWRQMVC